MFPPTAPSFPKPAPAQPSPSPPLPLPAPIIPNSPAEQIAHVGRHYTAIIEELRRQVAAKSVEDGQARGGPAAAIASARCIRAAASGTWTRAGNMETARKEADGMETEKMGGMRACVGEVQADHVREDEHKMRKALMMSAPSKLRAIETQLAKLYARVEKLESVSGATGKKRVHDRHKRKPQRRKEKARRIQRKVRDIFPSASAWTMLTGKQD